MDQQGQPRWRPTRGQVLWTGAALALSCIAILIGYRYSITLWDWLKLLVVPTVIAGGGLWYNRQQRERELEIASAQRAQELEIAEQRAQDEALQAYLDQIGQLLLEHNLRDPPEEDYPGQARMLARARTLTVLPRLNSDRKGSLVQYLAEARMLHKQNRGDPMVMLVRADLKEANLYRAILYMADFRLADLRRAYLSGADLEEADLSGADLTDATVDEGQLERAKSLEGATMPNGQKYEGWLKDKESGG